MPQIPPHLGGGCERPAPLPTREKETENLPDQIHFLAYQFGARGDVKIYDWLPKTSLEKALEHMRMLQKTFNGGKLFLCTYYLTEMHE